MAVTLKFKCKHCGEPNRAELALAGKPVTCQHCQAALIVPVPREPLPQSPGSAAPARATTSASPRRAPAQDTEGEYIEKAPPLRRLSAEKDPWVAARAAGDAVEETTKPRKRKRKKKKKGGPPGLEREEVLTVIAAVAASIVIVGLVAWIMPGMRSTLGLVLAAVGGLVALVGAAAFSNVARQEGDIHYLLCRFVPLYVVLFAIQHWDDVRGHIVFYFAGLAILFPGLMVWAWAPDFEPNPIKPPEQVNEAPEVSYFPAPFLRTYEVADAAVPLASRSPLWPTLELAASANPKEMSRWYAPLVV